MAEANAVSGNSESHQAEHGQVSRDMVYVPHRPVSSVDGEKRRGKTFSNSRSYSQRSYGPRDAGYRKFNCAEETTSDSCSYNSQPAEQSSDGRRNYGQGYGPNSRESHAKYDDRYDVEYPPGCAANSLSNFRGRGKKSRSNGRMNPPRPSSHVGENGSYETRDAGWTRPASTDVSDLQNSSAGLSDQRGPKNRPSRNFTNFERCTNTERHPPLENVNDKQSNGGNASCLPDERDYDRYYRDGMPSDTAKKDHFGGKRRGYRGRGNGAPSHNRNDQYAYHDRFDQENDNNGSDIVDRQYASEGRGQKNHVGSGRFSNNARKNRETSNEDGSYCAAASPRPSRNGSNKENNCSTTAGQEPRGLKVEVAKVEGNSKQAANSHRDDQSDRTSRSHPSSGKVGFKSSYNHKGPKSSNEDETQRGLLIEQLSNSTYECMICCNVVRRDAAIWACNNCYHVYHLYCIKRWANSAAATAGSDLTVGTSWRCPACQNPRAEIPNAYLCFCGKLKDPSFNQFLTPHSCGEMCNRERSRNCRHHCNLLCHPGPCPPCQAYITKSCACGKTKQNVRCSMAVLTRCELVCGRTLNCGKHDCKSVCHEGSCNPCTETITQACACGKETRSVLCGSQESFEPTYSCDGQCSRALDCGNHICERQCHIGPCERCTLQPSLVTHCPCGKTLLTDLADCPPRTTCTDDIPTCTLTCLRPLPCGSPDNPHKCQRPCHSGACGPCDGVTTVTCRCGNQTTDLPCQQVAALKSSSAADAGNIDHSDVTFYRCDRRCNKKMSCGRHKCGQLCCLNSNHQCQLICGYKLSCGQHKCEEPCHRGNCPPCWRVSFDELRCECGAEVIYPPVPCGTSPPACSRPCTRTHPCGHKVPHSCHSEPTCPPCPVLTEKWCHGHHELRSSIPCYIVEISCGRPCHKRLVCGVHKCTQSCHKGPCAPCTQPCPAPRAECGHPCSAPCHPGAPCPPTLCRTEITVRCECGRRVEHVACMQGASCMARDTEYGKAAAQAVASRLWEGQSIDISVLKKELKNKRLACTPECAVVERNQRLALALEIRNPDLSSKLGNPAYSQFLKDYARQNPTFVAGIEKALAELVQATSQLKVSKKSHSFKSMPNVQRRVVHELAENYGCQTESYDEEPNKNVVATAIKDKCWLPNVSLTSLVQRELFPKAPMPIPINSKEADIKSAAQAAKHSTQVYSADPKAGNPAATNKRSNPSTYIDYFDMTD